MMDEDKKSILYIHFVLSPQPRPRRSDRWSPGSNQGPAMKIHGRHLFRIIVSYVFISGDIAGTLAYFSYADTAIKRTLCSATYSARQ